MMMMLCRITEIVMVVQSTDANI